MTEEPVKSARQHLALATISFTLCFAAWGLISAFAPRFRTLFALSATQTALLVAVPVLLGSLARIPMGMLTDRFGGRVVFSLLMLASAIPALLVPEAASYRQLLGIGFFLGLAGSSFSVGVGYVSRWSPEGRQGSFLGVYGLGNIGQSAAVFLGPVLASVIGWKRGWEIFYEQGILRSLGRVGAVAVTHIAAQTFIRNRSVLRWWMHQCLFWGCLLAAAITFPLVFGWIHFESRPDDQLTYVSYFFGFPTFSFGVRSVTAWLLFHGLDISAMLFLTGIALALWRRMQDRGAWAVQSFARDLFPLVLLFAICVTGLALTVSVTWMRGA